MATSVIALQEEESVTKSFFKELESAHVFFDTDGF